MAYYVTRPWGNNSDPSYREQYFIDDKASYLISHSVTIYASPMALISKC